MTRPSPRSGGTARVALAALAALAVVLGSLGGGAPAGAHASLVATSPGDEAVLDAAPGEVVLEFTEDVSAGLGAVRVLDRSGARVDSGAVEADGGTVTAGLEPLDDGAYLVAWRVVSADSHPIKGTFTFTVGDGATRIDPTLAASLLGEDGDGPWRVAGALARALGYGGALLATGLAVFLAYVHDRGPERDGLRRTLRAAAVVGATGILVELPVRAALATGLGPSSLVEDGVASQLLGDRVGLGMLVALLTLLFVAVDAGRDRIVAAASVVALGVAFAVAGHTATTSPQVAAVASDALHVAAAAVWLGGVVGCAAVVLARRRDGGSPAAVVVGFSGVATLSLLGVAAGGSVLAWGEVRSLRALGTTAYGQLLLAKVAVVAVVATLGGLNRYRVVPLLEADLARAPAPAEDDPVVVRIGAAAAVATAPGPAAGEPSPGAADPTPAAAAPGTGSLTPGAATLLRRTLLAEVGLLALVVLLTAFLVDVTPARSAVAAPFAGAAAFGDGTVEIDVDPTRTGPTTIHLYAYDEAGQLLDVPDGVELRLSLPSSDVTGLVRVPEVTGTGHWTYEGEAFSIPGTWTVEVVGRVSQFEEESATFEVPIQP